MEKFIDKYMDEIYEGISREYPEYIRNSDTLLEDIPDFIVEEYIERFMSTKYKKFNDGSKNYE